MAEPNGYFISRRDYADYQALMAEFRAVGRTLRKPIRRGRDRTGRAGGRKVFARPITSETDPTPLTYAADTYGWFQPEHGPAHTNVGDDSGSPIRAYCLLTCAANTLCLVERIDARDYAVPLCEG